MHLQLTSKYYIISWYTPSNMYLLIVREFRWNYMNTLNARNMKILRLPDCGEWGGETNVSDVMG
jgi:hypothetical protein